MPPAEPPPSPLDRLLRPILLLISLGASDEHGRPIIATPLLLDENGPRDIALGAAAARRLVWPPVAILTIAFFGALFFWEGLTAVLFVGAILIRLFGTSPTRLTTRWLDWVARA